jgi:hypothetical protein
MRARHRPDSLRRRAEAAIADAHILAAELRATVAVTRNDGTVTDQQISELMEARCVHLDRRSRTMWKVEV